MNEREINDDLELELDEVEQLEIDEAVEAAEAMPIYLRDIADVRDTTEDLRSFTRINGKPGVRMRVSKQSGKNTVAIAQGVRHEVDRTNREVPSVHLSLIDDSSIYIERSISSVKEHAWFGGLLVVLIIFLFLRDLRSTLIICTSIPISLVGTFALLYFAGFTLNTMTFGGLALGIGMIVDAAIVVLENTHSHLHMGKDRMTASLDERKAAFAAAQRIAYDDVMVIPMGTLPKGQAVRANVENFKPYYIPRMSNVWIKG